MSRKRGDALDPMKGPASESLNPSVDASSGGTRSPEGSYWNSVVAAWQPDERHAAWRSHCEALSSDLLNRWLPHGRIARLLKTDLFDEAVAAGLVPALSARAESVNGIDIAESVVRGAKSRNPKLETVTADVRALPYADYSFDVILSGSTLDHFVTHAELETSLRELHRVLVRGGTLILTLDNPDNPLIALRNWLPRAALQERGIVPYYVGATMNGKRLRRVLTDMSFEVHEVSAFEHSPRVLAVALSAFLRDRASAANQERFARILSAFETLGNWPTRFLTGHFVAVRATRR
ncbi:MAG: class I SAM-dependent methyltransferase [Anaerolineae bacterium]|nr:class I SAM-dependent methyltransferase [Gemmatimonadaceae bacterium]